MLLNVKAVEAVTQSSPMSKYSAWNYTIAFGIQEGENSTSLLFSDGEWHHFAIQVLDSTGNDSSRLNVFVDGVKVYDELVSVDAPNFFDFSGPFNDLFIGANSDEESSFFKGLISELKI